MRAFHSQLRVAVAAAALAGAQPAKDSGMYSLDCLDGTRGAVLRAEHASISSEILSDADLNQSVTAGQQRTLVLPSDSVINCLAR